MSHSTIISRWRESQWAVLGDDYLEATLRCVGGRESNAAVDKCADQNQFLYVQTTQLFFEIRTKERAVGAFLDVVG